MPIPPRPIPASIRHPANSSPFRMPSIVSDSPDYEDTQKLRGDHSVGKAPNISGYLSRSRTQRSLKVPWARHDAHPRRWQSVPAAKDSNPGGLNAQSARLHGEGFDGLTRVECELAPRRSDR